MEQDGVPPDAISYKQALRACRAGAGTGGRAAHIALALVEELGSKGLGPDVVSLEIAARWGLVWFSFLIRSPLPVQLVLAHEFHPLFCF